ncbi:MAG: hypothetical protein AUJ98_04495 [Bacteroidetes bacterium CG2_30_33_31]|nr:MAG: hypothetical protein AUJ98_04495 [Bacteroidetes bacterium CG2_30_33_31]
MINKLFLFIFASILILFSINLSAKEGMYIPMLLQKINSSEMEAMGMKITAEDIYSINKSSIKDAIVQFGGGCTGEIISNQGLLLTNHHCGYRSIQKHSSINNDYLTDGFWANTFEDELPNSGLTATILQNMNDVTGIILAGVTTNMTEIERQNIIRINISKLTEGNADNKFIKLEVKAFYYGNQYILMTSKVFSDVRLVGAPPSNIGKFGGDTDNWMWPRHTGDFSVFRIYTDAFNNPAEYSKDNVAYKPAQSLSISLKGYNEGDFTFVFGYPGTTEEYLPAEGVALATETVNPFKISLRRQELDIMNSYMEKSAEIRIQYSAKYAGLANGWKKWIGESNGVKRLRTVERKTEEQKDFAIWANENEYKNLISSFKTTYKAFLPWEMAYNYFIEAGYYENMISFSNQFFKLAQLSTDKKTSEKDIADYVQNLKNAAESFYKDYNSDVEKELLMTTINAYASFPYSEVPLPETIETIKSKYQGDSKKYVENLFKKSIFRNKETLFSFLNNYKRANYKNLEKDILMKLTGSYFNNFINKIRPNLAQYQNKLDSLQRIYMKALIEKNADKYLSPDANSTLRVAYGNIANYSPHDGITYNYFTTLEGIMQKENPNIYDYVVEPKLKSLFKNKEYANYADADGTMHVCFLATNHTTGGNSGSPVMNANGELIGINFDRNWEGTMSDLNYDPEQCRNITLDIRYCLFIIDKFANAQRLIEEMNISR